MGIPRVRIRERDIPVFPSLGNGCGYRQYIKELALQLVKRRPEALPETLTLYEFLRRSREKTHQKGKGRQ